MLRVLKASGLGYSQSCKCIGARLRKSTWQQGFNRGEGPRPGRRCRMTDAEIVGALKEHTKVSSRFSARTKTRFRQLLGSVASVHRNSELATRYSYRQFARRLKLRKAGLGIVKSQRKSDVCPVEATWDAVVCKKL
eukprot:6787746-Lingulodinium_polyedra.AAC.1